MCPGMTILFSCLRGLILLICIRARILEYRYPNLDSTDYDERDLRLSAVHIEMEGNIAKELYGESLQVSKTDLASSSAYSSNENYDELALSNEDGPLWGSSDEELDRASHLDREWQKRKEQFHTIGYRDGIIAGKEAAAQEGFNIGFKESVLDGHNWGLVRGVSSALAFLPGDLTEKLIIAQETINKFRKLHESADAVSTGDALKLFYNDYTARNEAGLSKEGEPSAKVAGLQEQSSPFSNLENYVSELQSLISNSPAIEVSFLADKQPLP